jgi:hypothetical protein
MLAMQQLGCGQAGAAVLGGKLSIVPNAFAASRTNMEVAIRTAQVSLAGSNILDENLERGKQKSVCKDNKHLFCVFIDNGWNNRGPVKSYNSNSSHHITVGNRTGLVVALHYMSRRCRGCEQMEKVGKNGNESDVNELEIEKHDPKLCPQNYLGFSKEMEAHGALKSCIHLHKNHNVVYKIVVMDDDSSTENILKWNFEEAYKLDMIPEIPKIPAGNKRVNNGQLPLTNPPILRLADPNHRNRCMAGKFYKLARAKKGTIMCSTADTERLKRNMTYALHEYKSHDFETFKRMSWAVFYHHFNIHDDCGPWCRSLKYKDNPEELKKLHYRSTVEHAELYAQLLEIFETYCSDVALKDVHHLWHTNKCESMNAFITKSVNKVKHLCRTIVGKARTYLAVGLDSVGYEYYYRTLFELLHLDYDEDIMGTSHRRMDKAKIVRTEYDLRPDV